MTKLEHYIRVSDQDLRLGFTTGSAAVLASKAALSSLISQQSIEEVSYQTPYGILLTQKAQELRFDETSAFACIIKDAGDDPDVTDGLSICAHVSWTEKPGIHIEGGAGIGRVSLPGLGLEIGEAAINKKPREEIKRELQALLDENQISRGVQLCISCPEGESRAAKTFNPRLGIKGGISIIGTSGIVEPKSVQALKDSIILEIKQKAEMGSDTLILSFGNYGSDYVSDVLELDHAALISFSNYLGETLDYLKGSRFTKVLLVGHFGKMIKVASGIMDTHSKVADGRLEAITAHAALQGLSAETAHALMNSVSTDGALDILAQAGIKDATLASIAQAVGHHLTTRVGGSYEIEALCFSHQHGELFASEHAHELIRHIQNQGISAGETHGH